MSTAHRSAAPPIPPSGESVPLDIRNLSATYVEDGTTLQALSGLTFEIRAGEFVSLIGPSGSGKSTLLDIIAGLFPPSEGEIRLNGHPYPTEARLGRSSYMRQRDLLLPWRTALQNASLALEVHGVPRRHAERIAASRFADFGLAGFERAYPAQLSGGMRQRVAFLRTVLADRPLLLLDEPFGALDALSRVALQAWLLDLWEREPRAVLQVTHDVDEAIFLADRVITLSTRPGHIVHIEDISLPRPRVRAMVTNPAFLDHRIRLLDALGLLRLPEPVSSGLGRS
ncbi:MAG TPA: ABC transporter ATP-binding protein [Thermomicrobiales bacterium]|nr:ABC transporter ATP-binding protein [Thermomicrobiales bacterium]